MARKAPAPLSLNRYRSVWEMRDDGWITLTDSMGRLVELKQGTAEFDKQLEQSAAILMLLAPIERFWAFPGQHLFAEVIRWFEEADYIRAHKAVRRINRMLSDKTYRHREFNVDETPESIDVVAEEERERTEQMAQPYFEVLVVGDLTADEHEALRRRIIRSRRKDDQFIYDVVVAPTFEDAMIATLFNFNLQATIIRHQFPFKSEYQLDFVREMMAGVSAEQVEKLPESERGILLGKQLKSLRPEMDLYLVTDVSAAEVGAKVGDVFKRVFFRDEDDTELYTSIQRGVNERFRTPFFNALKEYSKQPTGVFHALPISRAKSIMNSNWIHDMAEFYGLNVFMAETSATSGGLDSLLEPVGPLKLAQEYAARAFGAKKTFFATNGTSTANKIVVQAIVKPDDIVIVDRNCHKSHHYGMVLAGAHVAYLDSYPLNEYSMYGAVPIRDLKRTLLTYKRAGTLDRVRMVLLTNCTFDGVVYNVERVMEECLAIKPDLVFLWDEAWFAFARFHPTYRHRTAMATAAELKARFKDPAYIAKYAKFAETMSEADWEDEDKVLNTRLLPDPAKARVRVYATHSTHKTLTSLRQGSMIHVWDQDFKDKTEEAFHEAYMTHTSTSPNYQILASLDVGRRQVELEGYELVQRQVDLAMTLRERIASHPLLKKYFTFLKVADMIPAQYRTSGVDAYYSVEKGWANMEAAWIQDEFALDPSRLTLAIGATGIDGDTFKNAYLMNKYGIQINKTSRNSVLFMTNIGTTRSSIAYLIEVLVKIAQEIDERVEDMSSVERRIHEQRIKSLTEDLPPLPDFSRFHPAFQHSTKQSLITLEKEEKKGTAKAEKATKGKTRADKIHEAIITPDGNIRRPFFLSYDEENCEYFHFGAIRKEIAKGRDVVSAMFVIPYPPGFPILVPGQVISQEIVDFMEALDVKEIHGYRPELGFRVFTEAALQTVIQPGE
ncbi:MAG: aminotransferase class I/II-fold pyridoxal phosphate-dependent enzyme [Formosimonas sp.]